MSSGGGTPSATEEERLLGKLATDGYALADKTPAQLAAEAKAAKRLATPRTSARGEPIPAHAFVAAAGGLFQSTPVITDGRTPLSGVTPMRARVSIHARHH